MAFFRLLRQPHLALLWASQVLSSAGDNFYNVALIWTAVNVAGSSAGLVIAAGTVTRIVLGPIGGALADRWDRRRTMIAADLLRAAAVAVLPLLHATSSLALWHLVAVSVALNGLGTLFDPALQASLPQLLRNREHLVAMNGLMDGTRRLAMALAPSLAGVLVAVIPLTQFFTLDAVSFCVSAVALGLIGRHFVSEAPAVTAARRLRARDIFSDIGEAVAQVRQSVLLPWFLVSQAVSNIAWAAAFNVGAALLSAHVLSGEVGSYGLILGAYGAGNILGNFVIGNLRINNPVFLLCAAKVVLGAGIAILALGSRLELAVAGAFVASLGGPMGDLMLLHLMHRDLPQGQIGRVYALRMTIASIGIFTGLLLAGPLFSLLSPQAGIAVCAALMTATGLSGFVRFGLGRSSARTASPGSLA